MNKLFEQAKRNIEKRKIEAESKRDAKVSALDADFFWKELNKEIRQLQVEISLYKNADEKTKKRLCQLQEKRRQFLQQKGLDESFFDADYFCKKCNDTGVFDGHRCQCLSRELRRILFFDSKTNGENCTFENSSESLQHNKLIYQKCQEFCAKRKNSKIKNILVCGKTGTGKTYLLQCILNELLNSDCEICFFTAYSLGQQFLNCHLSDLESKRLYLDNIIDADVLIVDDLGTEQIYKNVTMEFLFAVLNERKQLGKSTIFSTNLSLQQLKARYEDRIFSRVLDNQSTAVFELLGNDKRVQR